MATETETAARIAQLSAMLASRTGKPGFKRNVEALRAEIARLEGQ